MFNEPPGVHRDATRQRSPLTRSAAVVLLALYVAQRAGHNLVADFSRVPISAALVHGDETTIIGYKVGCTVRIRGTGEWSSEEHFHVRVVDIRDDGETVEVRYRHDKGTKCFDRSEFEGLLSPMPADGGYDVNMVVPLQRKGPLFLSHYEWATIVDVRSSDATVKVHFQKGGYQRFKREEFEHMFRREPWDQIDKEIPYHKPSHTIVTAFLGLLICHVWAMFSRYRSRADVWTCYTAPFAPDFRFIGLILAATSFVDTISKASLQATPCRILDHFKLVLTALMMWMLVGRSARPTVMMWLALLSTTLSTVTLTLVTTKHEGVERRPVTFVTIVLVLSRVALSSGLASFGHLSFKRNRRMPLYAHLSQLFLVWGFATLAWSLAVEPEMMSSTRHFFQGWSRYTLFVVLSSLIKMCLTMLVLKYLDSITKSIGDVLAVVFLHCLHVVLPMFSKRFEAESFLAIWVIVTSLVAYVLLKEDHANIVALHESIRKLREPLADGRRRRWNSSSSDVAMGAIPESPDGSPSALVTTGPGPQRSAREITLEQLDCAV